MGVVSHETHMVRHVNGVAQNGEVYPEAGHWEVLQTVVILREPWWGLVWGKKCFDRLSGMIHWNVQGTIQMTSNNVKY